jgi:hypothetical protein
MTDAGWHPDPHGRADRRYHDGTAWTAHVADAAGTVLAGPASTQWTLEPVRAPCIEPSTSGDPRRPAVGAGVGRVPVA